MPGVVHVRHAAPVLMVPARGRTERVAMAPLSTPVTLREVDPDALGEPAVRFGPQGMPPARGLAYHVFEGGYWHDLSGFSDARRFGVEDFVRHLSGALPDRNPFGSQLRRTFYQTPVPMVENRAQGRGEDVEVALARLVLDDRREEWAGHLREHLARNVVVTGERVFVRACGPLTFLGKPGGLADFTVEPFPRLAASPRSLYLQYCRPDRLGEHRHVLGDPGNVRRRPTMEEWPDGFDPGLLGNDDIHLFLNAAPAVLCERLKGYDYGPDSFGARKLAELRPWVWRGEIGAITLDEADAVLRLLRGTIVEMNDVRRVFDPHEYIHRTALYIDRIALPRLREAHALRPDDADALAGLGMGGP